MLKKSVALVLCFVLASCATPPGVPRGASVGFDHLEGPVWSWRRTLEHGCADWSATQQWAVTQLSVDRAKCEGGPGLSYQTGVDYLVFQNYAPLLQGELTARLTFDSQGQAAWRQCPFSLSSAQLQALRTIAHEALARATTDAERRTFTRIDELLAATDGAALVSGQFGCTDEMAQTNQRLGVSPRVDTWWNTSTAVVPCDNLPAGAVTAVPPPFDQYLELVCTQAGQALAPVDGYRWIFETGYVWRVQSTNFRSPAPSDHFVRLIADPLSEAEAASLRDELTNSIRFRRLTGGAEPSAVERTIIRLSVQRSWGGVSQIYLFVPPQGASREANVLGMDCGNADCRPIYRNTLFFTVTPSPDG